MWTTSAADWPRSGGQPRTNICPTGCNVVAAASAGRVYLCSVEQTHASALARLRTLVDIVSSPATGDRVFWRAGVLVGGEERARRGCRLQNLAAALNGLTTMMTRRRRQNIMKRVERVHAAIRPMGARDIIATISLADKDDSNIVIIVIVVNHNHTCKFRRV